MLPAKAIPNFVACSALFLPFRNGVFDCVFCGQVIEHVKNPVNLLRELVRVSKWKVVVETMHWFGETLTFSPQRRRWFREHHISKFNSRWLCDAFRKLGCCISESYVAKWYYLPHKFVPLFRFPSEIGVAALKVKSHD
jgi:ubiquinone/menaquinone biosynthesis C-methylase UbiE